MNKKLFPREKYLSKIRPFYDSDIVKVITGIRRCGKSSILKSIIDELLLKVNEDHIIYLPLDKKEYKQIKTPRQLEEKIESFIHDDDFYYLIIDEVQNVKGFEEIILQYEEEGYSVFLTGSNSYLLSDEISTKLTGRYLTFETYPLDFKEYIEMKKFYNKNIKDLYDEFNEYLLIGGFPKTIEFDNIFDKQFYTKEITKEIFNKDVKTRNKVKNIALYERVQSYIINNYSSPTSLNKLHLNLEKSGINTKKTTLSKYINILKKSKIIYECNRFDLKSNRSLIRDQKYYLADLSLYFSNNVDNSFNYGPSLENIVYLYLISNGYEVSVGKIGNLECDFIVRKPNHEYAYIQVAFTLNAGDLEISNKIKERELRPFRNIKNAYPRYIITLDRFNSNLEGVNVINAIDLFLGKYKI